MFLTFRATSLALHSVFETRFLMDLTDYQLPSLAPSELWGSACLCPQVSVPSVSIEMEIFNLLFMLRYQCRVFVTAVCMPP